jgi:hypothetical protein
MIKPIRTEQDRKQLIRLIENRDLPFSVSLTKGVKRSDDQNRLQRLWMKEAEEQGDQTAEEYRAYCKLHHGVVILRTENAEFCEVYDRIIKPLPYEQKLELMKTPMDFPVTRLMNTSQKKRYLDAIYVDLTGMGITLTDPDAAGMQLVPRRTA